MTHSHILDGQVVHFSVMIVVRDLERSATHYVNHFGFEIVQRLQGLRLLEREAVSLYLVTESPPTPDKPGVRLVPPSRGDRVPVLLIFKVRDVRAVHAALVEKGLVFLTPPVQPPWGGWRCFAQDPDGYLVEIEES